MEGGRALKLTAFSSLLMLLTQSALLLPLFPPSSPPRPLLAANLVFLLNVDVLFWLLSLVQKSTWVGAGDRAKEGGAGGGETRYGRPRGMDRHVPSTFVHTIPS